MSRLPLQQLSPCATRGVAYCVRAVSEPNKLRSGVILRWQYIAEAPLWNSRTFVSQGQTVTCRCFIQHGVLQVKDLVDTASWSMLMEARHQGPLKLRAVHWSTLCVVLRKPIRA